MLELGFPTRHEWQVLERDYGRIFLEPFEPGCALIIGNTYRRVILCSTNGAAPTWVKIEGVLHQFTPIAALTEDALEIVANLRKVVFALYVNRAKLIRLKAQGPKLVRAGEFESDADLEILTPEQPLATVGKDGTLEMEVCIERGRGYLPAEKQEPEAPPIDAILMDADFSPIRRVNFRVEPVAGETTKQERLVLDIWTNGTVTPEASIGQASRILEDHFELFTNFPPGGPRGGRGGACRTASQARSEPLPERGGAGAVGARLQLPQEQQCSYDRGSGAAQRGRAREDQEFREEVTERDQGNPGRNGALPWDAFGS